MSSEVSVPTVPEDAGSDQIDPATSRRMGSITYDREENGYNLEWESRADFERWLKHEQNAIGVEIRLAKTRVSTTRDLYLTCDTFRCAQNGTGGLKAYVKKTARERKIDSKRIDSGCPCYVQIKTYPHTDAILGKYDFSHSHETGKDNFKYIRIRVSTRELIEVWVRYGVTTEEIVSNLEISLLIATYLIADKQNAKSIQ
jgi:hypothetical protein